MNHALHKTILKDLKERAISKGGDCLSEEYIHYTVPLLWRCKKGHTWETTSAVIKREGWCPACALSNRRNSIEDFQEIAANNGGKCLSTEYISSKLKLKWQCMEGHIWESAAANIKSGHWCKICVFEKIAAPRRLSVNEMHELAKKKGGLCLSSTYKNSSTPILWQCKEGHQWKSTLSAVKHRGDWCKKCAGLQRGTIGEMRRLARKHGGECLSPKYTNRRTKLTWKCKEEHVWDALPYPIKEGTWCGICADKETGLKKRELQLKKIKQVLKKFKYALASEDYINNNFITLVCRKGHCWQVLSRTIIKERGLCPDCIPRPGPKKKL
jgi:hypothetical protein